MYVCKCCGKEVNTGQDNREPFSAHAENKGSYPKWRLRDYIALAALSLRKSVWLRGAVPEFGAQTTPAIRYLLVVFVGIAWPYYALVNFCTRTEWDWKYIWMTYQEGMSVFIFLFVLLLLFAFRLKYVWYNVRYRKSSWWKDTGIRPGDISNGVHPWLFDKEKNAAHQGLYGEYLAGMAAERLLKKSKVYGCVLHGVLIPTDNNGGFTEADMVVVSEYGIQSVEVKYWRSTVSGNLSDTSWDGHPNPFYQNLYHCNMLFDYLYSQLPYGSTLKNRNLNEVMKNVVLFTTPVFDDFVNQDISFYRSYGGFTENYFYLDGYEKDGFDGDRKVFSPAEVDEIVGILKACVFPEPEKSRRMEMRKLFGAQESRDVIYTVRKMECPGDDGQGRIVTVLEREVNGHKAYLDCCDNRFRAMPCMKDTGEVFASFCMDNTGWEAAEICPAEVWDALMRYSNGEVYWFDREYHDTSSKGDKFAHTDRKRKLLDLLHTTLAPVSGFLSYIVGGILLKYASLYISVLVLIIAFVMRWTYFTDPVSDFQMSLFLYVAWFLCPLGFPQIYYFLTEMLENFVERLGDLLIAR